MQNARNGLRCCGPQRCASGSRGCTICICRAPVSSRTRTIRSSLSASCVAAPLLKPVFAVGFLAAAWTQERGGAPAVRQLFQGFRSNVFALCSLGVVFVLGMMIAVGATAAIDGGKLFDLIANPAPQDLDQDAVAKRLSDTLSDSQVQLGMLLAALCAIPTLLALWWAPALVVF